jgi:nucleoside phosphorylase
VIDIEGGRAEPSETKPRPSSYRVVPALRPLLRGFNYERWNWLADRDRGLELLKETRSRLPKTFGIPKCHQGVIVSGEKLRRDGVLPELAAQQSDEIIAVEMEGAGFAATCDDKGIGWLVFRGISDFADMKKRDTWQPLAALHAALAAKCFIEHGLRPRINPSF